MSAPRRLARLLAPLAVVAVGVVALVVFVKTKPAPAKRARPATTQLVELAVATSSEQQLRVRAQGTVVPAREIVIQPEVSGRIVEHSPELVPGGLLKKGSVAIRIDAREYSLAARQQSASVDRARLDLELERSRASIAEREWAIIDEDRHATPEGRELALRKPQLHVAKANVASAESALATARLRVGRTRIAVPFNALVVSESIDVGQMVSPQTPLARLVGTDHFWVQVSIPMDHLGVVSVPGIGGAKEGSAVTITQEIGGKRVERSGSVARLLGDVDPVGRLARLVIEITDPLGLAAGREGDPAVPMLLGSYVTVSIEGRTLEQVVEIPRTGLREGDRVFVYEDGKLRIRDVAIAWRRPTTVLLRGGVKGGERVVVSRVATPVEGMPLRTAEATAAPGALGQR